MTQSKIGDIILVGIVTVAGRMMFCPDENLFEVYTPDNREAFDRQCKIGEIWHVEVLGTKEVEITEKSSYVLIRRVTVKLLRRDEFTDGHLERSAKEWVAERKSGVRVLEATRVPVRILQKRVIEGNFQVTIERVVNRLTEEKIAEYEHSRVTLDEVRERELEKLKADALSRRRIRGT